MTWQEYATALEKIGRTTEEVTESIVALNKTLAASGQSLEAEFVDSIAWQYEDDTKYDWQEDKDKTKAPTLTDKVKLDTLNAIKEVSDYVKQEQASNRPYTIKTTIKLRYD